MAQDITKTDSDRELYDREFQELARTGFGDRYGTIQWAGLV